MVLNTFALLLFSLLSPGTLGRPVCQSNSTVEVANRVRYLGTSTDNIESFLNIRFGQNTGGSNRFAAPKPYTYPPGSVVNATQPGAGCPQQKVPIEGLAVFDNVTQVSEDCLTLRIDRPANTSRMAKLPVMAFIYGGGDSIGQIYDTAYEPGPLISNAVQQGYPVIYVAMNYRVGVFGFAASDAINATGSLNAGLLDQRLGLNWVQEHIAAFGGDPDNVTIFGESDGATGVGLQITAYGGDVKKTPFKRAIMQSGNPAADGGTASNISAVHTSELIRKVNCASSTSDAELACLQKLPLSELLPTAIEYEFNVTGFGFDVFEPTAPSPFIPDNPSTLLTTGRFAHNIDIVAGWTEDDSSFFTPPTLKSDKDVIDLIYTEFPSFSKENVQKLLDLYPVASFSDLPKENISAQYFRASRMMRDSEFVCPTLYMVQMNQKYSDKKTSNYLYVLNQTMFAPLLAQQGTTYLGVSHFSDIPYAFNLAKTRYSFLASPSDVELSTEMSSSWASFAASGEASGKPGTVPNWPVTSDKNSSNQYKLRVLGGPNDGLRTISDDKNSYEQLLKRCDFWTSPEEFQEMGV